MCIKYVMIHSVQVIGWRNQARRLILSISDERFKTAGQGKVHNTCVGVPSAKLVYNSIYWGDKSCLGGHHFVIGVYINIVQ